MAYANYPPWNSMTPVTPICPPQSQNSFTTPNLSRFQSNNQSNVSLNFSNLGNNFDGSMNTPDSGYANANNASILSLQRQQKQANQSENIARGGKCLWIDRGVYKNVCDLEEKTQNYLVINVVHII